MEVIVEEKVEIVFSSADKPALWTPFLKENNINWFM